MGFIQLNHVQEYEGQTMTNRYFYNTTDPIIVEKLSELQDLFEIEVVPRVIRLQHNTVQHVRLETRELEGVLFSVKPLTQVGLNVDEPSPSWNALSFLLQRGDGRTKSGGKRIGGISEANIIGNQVFPDPLFDQWLIDYADSVSALLVGTIGNYVPTLIKFDPLNAGVIINSQPIVGASFSRLSTQATRR
jgi:hypothetical protein